MLDRLMVKFNCQSSKTCSSSFRSIMSKHQLINQCKWHIFKIKSIRFKMLMEFQDNNHKELIWEPSMIGTLLIK